MAFRHGTYLATNVDPFLVTAELCTNEGSRANAADKSKYLCGDVDLGPVFVSVSPAQTGMRELLTYL